MITPTSSGAPLIGSMTTGRGDGSYCLSGLRHRGTESKQPATGAHEAVISRFAMKFSHANGPETRFLSLIYVIASRSGARESGWRCQICKIPNGPMREHVAHDREPAHLGSLNLQSGSADKQRAGERLCRALHALALEFASAWSPEQRRRAPLGALPGGHPSA